MRPANVEVFGEKAAFQAVNQLKRVLFLNGF